MNQYIWGLPYLTYSLSPSSNIVISNNGTTYRVAVSALNEIIEGENVDLSDYATIDYVNSLSAFNQSVSLTGVNLSAYATWTALSASLSAYSRSNQLSSFAPLSSLNTYARSTDLTSYATNTSLSAYLLLSNASNFLSSASITTSVTFSSISAKPADGLRMITNPDGGVDLALWDIGTSTFKRIRLNNGALVTIA